MLWEVLRKILGLELRPDPSEAWLMAGRAPGTCSREPPPLEPREDTEPVGDNVSAAHLDHICLIPFKAAETEVEL